MEILDNGHVFLLKSYDGFRSILLVFMKREGIDYPNNVGHYPGTNCQEVLRALIARVQYLQHQIWCWHNWIMIKLLRITIWLFERRAAKRHKRKIPFFIPNIEELATCIVCGHIYCEGKHHE